MANKIQIKRGLESNINKSNLLQGELAVTTDSNKLYVGTSKGPIQLNKDDESLVIIDYYETDESKKEKIKSLFIKEDGSPSEHQLVKPCILLAPTVEPTSTTSIYTKGQWICAFGDTESNLISELTNERAITKYNLIFMTMDMGLNLIYNVSEDTITYTWMENALEATYNKITKIGTPETINDKHYPSEKAVYDYVNEKAVAKDTGWITCTTVSSNGVGTINPGNTGGSLQVRKVGKVVYLNLALSLDLIPDTATANQYLLTLNEKYRPTQTIYFTTLLTSKEDSQFNQLCTVTISPNGKVELPNYVEIARKQVEVGSSALYLNHLVSYPV